MDSIRCKGITLYKQYYPTWLNDCTHKQLVEEYKKDIELEIKIPIIYDKLKKNYQISLIVTKKKLRTMNDTLYYAKNGKFIDDIAYTFDEQFQTTNDVATFIMSIYDKCNDHIIYNTFVHDYVLYGNMSKKGQKVWCEEPFYPHLKNLINIMLKIEFTSLPTMNFSINRYELINRKKIYLLCKNGFDIV